MITVTSEEHEVMIALMGGEDEVLNSLCVKGIEKITSEATQWYDIYRVNVYVDNDGMGTNGFTAELETTGGLMFEVSLFDGDVYSKALGLDFYGAAPKVLNVSPDDMPISSVVNLLTKTLKKLNKRAQVAGIVLN